MTSFKLKNLNKDVPAKRGEILGISSIDCNKKILGFTYIPKSPHNLIVEIDGNQYPCLPEFKDKLFFNGSLGYYNIKDDFDDTAINRYEHSFGHDKYPYLITREYEAIKHLDEFKGAQIVNNQNIINDRVITRQIKYTFGLEFETSMGFIPQEICFENGLVPLRDGSITGVEYSTVVLSNDDTKDVYGTELLQQQLLELRKRCFFNKECALHIHFGGYPVDPKALYILHLVENCLESTNYEGIIPRYSFFTSKYKKNGKDYCMKLPEFYSFNDMFKFYTGMKFLGSLEQPHPNDTTREQKWRISTRYFGLNFINMLCYSGPKTVEFRFLRPTFNYRKIRLWLLIFNAILEYSKRIYESFKSYSDVQIYKMIISSGVRLNDVLDTYDVALKERILQDCERLRYVVDLQELNGDPCGDRVDIENSIFKDIL